MPFQTQAGLVMEVERADSIVLNHQGLLLEGTRREGNSKQRPDALVQVFARTIICRDLDVATRVVRTDGLDCITLEGDQVSKKGGMTGGFYDYRRSKLRFMSIVRLNTIYISEKQNELEQVRQMLQEIDQKINELVAEQQKNDAKLAHDKSELEQFRQDIANAEGHKLSISKALEKKILDTNPQLFFHLQKQRLMELITNGKVEEALEFASKGEENVITVLGIIFFLEPKDLKISVSSHKFDS
ncbi:PREDICTED: structural maintenance of chromosomes protein 3-like [Ipomoea nil]|uniref:structural maintenance of chromosomes protein 3-like n=1 Tax=Ipomoea nil TaxID=35883 RepID=UPI0009019FA2|nr:PREDICTED: structural maintenance of chromosomes protein 3-like [Ipomoea nil]